MTDAALIQIVDAALLEAARKSGDWLACRPGCFECCIGPFPISPLDAQRLREGLAELERVDTARAQRVRQRARDYVEADEEPCPALDPETGTCDLYAARPMTCRIFGPAVRSGSGAVGACELCYHGATDEQIAACAVDVDPDELESTLLQDLERTTGAHGDTTVALALR